MTLPDATRPGVADTTNRPRKSNRLGGTISKTDKPLKQVDQACKHCGRLFKRERQDQKYCRARCRNAAVKARSRRKSGDTKAVKRRLPLPHREAVTFGQKRATKSKANFAPRLPDFRRPVVDLLDRPSLYADRPPEIAEDVRLRWADLLRRVVRDECANYPRRYRRPPVKGDVVIETDATWFPIMSAFLRRRGTP
jgi:hypothetical protein